MCGVATTCGAAMTAMTYGAAATETTCGAAAGVGSNFVVSLLSIHAGAALALVAVGAQARRIRSSWASLGPCRSTSNGGGPGRQARQPDADVLRLRRAGRPARRAAARVHGHRGVLWTSLHTPRTRGGE